MLPISMRVLTVAGVAVFAAELSSGSSCASEAFRADSSEVSLMQGKDIAYKLPNDHPFFQALKDSPSPLDHLQKVLPGDHSARWTTEALLQNSLPNDPLQKGLPNDHPLFSQERASPFGHQEVSVDSVGAVDSSAQLYRQGPAGAAEEEPGPGQDWAWSALAVDESGATAALAAAAVASGGAVEATAAAPDQPAAAPIAPFGREDTATELQNHAARTQDTLVDAVEHAEVAEIKRAVFRSLTRLRAAEIKEFDTIARLETQAIDEYNDAHHYRADNPLEHISGNEPEVGDDKFTSFHD